jgi:DMATS type aromatic prenyltransferase
MEKYPWPRLRQLAERRIDSVCATLGKKEWAPAGRMVLDELCGEWPSWQAAYDPVCPSDITDDSSPFELSLAFERDEPSLRMLVEPQARPRDPQESWAMSSWHATQSSFERLRAMGAHLESLERVWALFAPLPTIPVRFSSWLACTLGASGPRDFKIYLNPQVVGVEGAMILVHRAMTELGLEGSLESTREALSDAARPTYFSLDLSPRPGARAKVYFAHPGESVADVLAQTERAGADVKGLRRRLEALAAGPTESLSRPLQSCFAFRDGVVTPEATVYVPLRACAATDAEALDRLEGMLSPGQLAWTRSAAAAMASRELEQGRGLVTYAGLRAGAERPRVVVYLSPQVYASQSVRAPVASVDALETGARRATPSSPPDRKNSGVRVRVDRGFLPTDVGELRALVDRERDELSHHALFSRLRHDASLEDVRSIAPRVAFFVMAFQDVLRIVTEKTSDPVLRQLARAHQLEDAGHDHWYLRDLEILELSTDVATLFSRDARAIRDVSYHQIAEAIAAESDVSRFAVVLCLEAAGVEFFSAMVDGLDRLGRAQGLLYFSKRHQDVEASHEIFEERRQEEIDALLVPSAAAPEVVRAVVRTFETMRSLADELAKHVPVRVREARSA